jgi:methylthioribose-1-phosphate isomerase
MDVDYARYDRIRPIRWTGTALELLDQRKLPFETDYVVCAPATRSPARSMRSPCAARPAIGIAAAWGVVLAERAIEAADAADAAAKLEPALQRLNAARPTAVNLAWALARMRAALARAGHDWREGMEREAEAIDREDLAATATWARSVLRSSNRAAACSRTAIPVRSRPPVSAPRSA